ncbi:MAG: hypothetical protein PHO20_04385 [Candidatus Peribacteraceae bacterium]|nr:hypothetical protein [Candidatus Peribacteraceae bacterium]MDD5739978.1 hypothetical protein [Candidatus Peribacteraceae bacterium]
MNEIRNESIASSVQSHKQHRAGLAEDFALAHPELTDEQATALVDGHIADIVEFYSRNGIDRVIPSTFRRGEVNFE